MGEDDERDADRRLADHRPVLRRARPPQEPGPRLLPIIAIIAVVGFALGAVGKIVAARFAHHSYAAVLPHATPSPNYAALRVKIAATNLPPIPTPRGTWYVNANAQPFHVVLATTLPPAAVTTPRATTFPIPLATVQPTPSLAPTPLVTPTPMPTVTPKPAPVLTPRIVKTYHPIRKHPVHVAVTRKPLAVATSLPATPEVTSTPVAVVTVLPTASPLPPVPQRIVRRYLSALIRGNEPAAYALLGAAPGDPGVSLSEESFINTSAHISLMSSHGSGSGATVHAEVDTAGGAYYATYHLVERNGHLIIGDHDFIKL